MRIVVNGTERQAPDTFTLLEAKKRYAPRTDIMILDGYQTAADAPLYDGAQVTFIEKGRMPGKRELEHMLAARNTPGVQQKISGACVGIAGLGGLGSNIAELLCRSGVGKLVLADFDTVEPSNLNRQNYRVCHLGMPKPQALAKQLSEMNPYIRLELHHVRVTPENLVSLFGGCSVLCEAFDSPEEKAMLVCAAMERLPDLPVVAASGMAGLQSANRIQTVKRMKNLYLCGDGETAAMPGQGLMAPRVSICAGHQANMVLRLLTGMEQP